jgi:hypothetical protein
MKEQRGQVRRSGCGSMSRGRCVIDSSINSITGCECGGVIVGDVSVSEREVLGGAFRDEIPCWLVVVDKLRRGTGIVVVVRLVSIF